MSERSETLQEQKTKAFSRPKIRNHDPADTKSAPRPFV